MTNNKTPGQAGAGPAILLPGATALAFAKQHALAIDVLTRRANTLPRGADQAHVLAMCDLEAKITQAYALVALADQLVKHPLVVRQEAS